MFSAGRWGVKLGGRAYVGGLGFLRRDGGALAVHLALVEAHGPIVAGPIRKSTGSVAVPLGPNRSLVEDQKPARAGNDARVGRGLDAR
jgi:hypothetical protein